MDSFTFSKLVHVAAAILWLGGGMSHVLLGAMAISRAHDADFLSAIRNVAVLGKRVLVPCMVVTLLTGLSMMWLGGLGLEAWLVFGLLGILATGAIGGMVLGPLSEKTSALSDDPATRAEAIATGRRVVRFAAADSIVLLLIVYFMVVRPGWQHTLLWLLPLAVALGLSGVILSRKDALPFSTKR
jgi:hypothetical protein